MRSAFSQPCGNGADAAAMTDLESMTNISHLLLSVLPFVSPPDVAQLACALWGLGSLTLVLSLTTVLHLPDAGPVFGRCAAAYYAILGIVILVVVPVELGTALCLTRCSDGCRLPAFATGLLRCAFLLLLVVISVGMLFLEVSLVEFLLQGNEASGYDLFGAHLNLLSLEL